MRCLALILLAALAGCDDSRAPKNGKGDTAIGDRSREAVPVAALAIRTGVQTSSGRHADLGGATDSTGRADPGARPDSDTPEACSDGKDNDGDGLMDWQYDLGCYGPDDSTEGGLRTRELDNGWSVFEPSEDTKIIYVSSSLGNDANPGTSPAKPKKTLAAGLAAVRSSHPDWVLLARGDTWTESLRVKEGRSRTEPFVVATYGDSTKRPLLKTGTNAGLEGPGKRYNNFAVVGIAFYAHTRDPKSSAYRDASGKSGFNFISKQDATGQGILLEDCSFNFYTKNVIQGRGVNEDIVLRRNVITNNYSTTSHSQGLYSKNASILLEENIFDHNGWYKPGTGKGNDKSDGRATVFNHNTYFVNQHKTTFRRNIFLRPSSIGNKWTANDGPGSASDIVIDDNLYVDGEVGIGIGGNDPVAPYRFKNVLISNNVFLDIGRSRPTNRTLGLYLSINDWDGGRVSKNLFLHQRNTAVKGVHAMIVKGVTRDVVAEDNVIYGLYTRHGLIRLSEGETKQNVSFVNNKVQSQIHGATLIVAPEVLTNYAFRGNTYYSARDADQWFKIGESDQRFMIGGPRGDIVAWKKASGATGSAKKVPFLDPTRSIETYQKALGQTATIDAFIAAVLGQSKYNWRKEYTAAAVNDWIRAGFVP